MTTTTENAPANMYPVPADPEAKAEAVKDAPATDAAAACIGDMRRPPSPPPLSIALYLSLIHISEPTRPY